jgi:hypothetical protein
LFPLCFFQVQTFISFLIWPYLQHW